MGSSSVATRRIISRAGSTVSEFHEPNPLHDVPDNDLEKILERIFSDDVDDVPDPDAVDPIYEDDDE